MEGSELYSPGLNSLGESPPSSRDPVWKTGSPAVICGNSCVSNRYLRLQNRTPRYQRRISYEITFLLIGAVSIFR